MTNDIDIKKVRSDLTRMRTKVGPNSAAGHRCSNLLEQLEVLATATDRDQRQRLEKAIGRSVAELSALTKGNQA